MADDAIALCRYCQAQGFCRFGVGEFTLTGTERAEAQVRCAESFEAGPRVAHGGWTAAMFDDVLGRFLSRGRHRVVTGSLTIDYLRPVPVEEDLVATMWVVSREGRRWTVAGELRLAGGTEALARASGLWIERRPDHFERHEAAMCDYRDAKAGSTNTGPA
ncbi:MAG: PaaI family thioesterase [Allosphingosinicella sp.]|uniref:PaaI family thioesterase n=1 Tax=Allosphingosinicella sp. TaxID=2823234 RepID=UPI00392C970E